MLYFSLSLFLCVIIYILFVHQRKKVTVDESAMFKVEVYVKSKSIFAHLAINIRE